METIAEKKEIENAEEGEEVEIREEGVFEVEQTPLLYTRASRYYKERLRSKIIIHTSVVEKAICLWWMGL